MQEKIKGMQTCNLFINHWR